MTSFNEAQKAEIEQLFGRVRQGRFVSTQAAVTPYESPIGPGNINPSGFLADGSISDMVLFASTIRPPEVLAALPALPDAAYPQGSFVFLTTDQKLYRNTDGSTWSVAVDGADIIANSITAGQIAAGAIGTSELAARSVIIGNLADPVGNMVSNPGFEIDANATIDPNITGWLMLYTTAANFVVSTTLPHGGAKCLLVTASATDPQAIAGHVGTDGLIPVEPNKTYHIGCWFRGKAGNNAAAHGIVEVEWFDSGFSPISSTDMTQTVGASTTWVQQTENLTAPSTAAYMKLSLIVEPQTAGDVIGFDDVGVYRQDRDLYHAGGNVVINSSGITITNGMLTITDDAGTSVLTGVGFGAAWRRFLLSGIYNGDFFGQPPTPANPITGANPLPYWTYTNVSGTGVTFTNAANSSYASGRVLRMVMASGAAGDEAYLEQIVPINGSGSRNYHYRPSIAIVVTAASPSPANNIGIGIRAQYLKNDGTTTTGSASNSLYTVSSVSAVVRDLQNIGLGTPPADAYFLRLRITMARGSAANSDTATVDVTEARLTVGSEVLVADYSDPATYPYGQIQQSAGNLILKSGKTSPGSFGSQLALGQTTAVLAGSGTSPTVNITSPLVLGNSADIFAYRSAAKTLTVDTDGVGGALTAMDVIGTLKQSGTAVSVAGHGSADHADITRTFFLPAATAFLDSGTFVDFTTAGRVIRTVNLANAATQGCGWAFLTPSDYVSGLTFQPVWAPSATDGTAHTVRWTLNRQNRNAGGNITSAGDAVAFTGASAARTANIIVEDTATAMGGIAPVNVTNIEIQRIGADAADTYVGDVRLLGLIVSYTANQ